MLQRFMQRVNEREGGRASPFSSFGQIRNCSGQIGIVDQLEAAFAAVLAGRGERGIFGISEEGADGLSRWKLKNRNKAGIERLAFQCFYVPGA